MKHGLYYRLYWTNDDCTTEIESICTQKNIQRISSRPSYVRELVVKYFMKKIATFVEKHYVSKKREEDRKPFVRYDYQCGICYETRTTFNLCGVCKFSMCIDCIKRLQTVDCVYCRTQYIVQDLSHRDTQRLYKEMFGDRINFVLCIDLFDMLYSVLSNSEYVVVKEDYNCYCHTEPKHPGYFLIRKNQRTGVLTNCDVLEQLLERGYERDIDTCAHYFFEGCGITNFETNNEVEILWGS